MEEGVEAVLGDDLGAVSGGGLEQDGEKLGGVLFVLRDWGFGFLSAGEEVFEEGGGGAYEGGDGRARREVF